MALRGWIINDLTTTIPGTRTLWSDLVDWLPGAQWKGSAAFQVLANRVESIDEPLPDYIVRNASYFRKLTCETPTISLLQDIFPEGPARMQQVEVCKASALIVFNTQYTRAQYPELAGAAYRIIPLPVDFDQFRPMPEIEKRWDVCWIGAASHVKGWDILENLIRTSNLSWCIVVKDQVSDQLRQSLKSGIVIHSRVTHSELPAIINSCRFGLCTSRQETQHLAGIEMGACGLKMLASPVGVYFKLDKDEYGLDEGRWGWSVSLEMMFQNLIQFIKHESEEAESVRAFWMSQGFDKISCKAGWEEAVHYVTRPR